MPISERRIVSVLILVLSAGLAASTLGLSFADLGSAFSPMFFPRIVLGILTLLALINVLIDLRSRDATNPINVKPVLIIGVAFLGYVLLLMPLGYFITSVAMGVIVLLALGLRSPVMLVLVPVLSAGSLIVLFNHVLKMPLPASPFFWWL